MVALDRDAVVSQAGDQTEHVLFPHSGAISVMIDMANGQTIASAAIGREGAIGTLSVLGPSPSAVTAVVRAAGIASRIPASDKAHVLSLDVGSRLGLFRGPRSPFSTLHPNSKS
ncbi:cyclic nucleotide-binding domain-containing protein [Bradyrhizobium canariense]|uniref:cyclic nucleotide-binding domain-containing protein n=1 Tax=Bradyrhizobium canariense TaxID=255045 RepID=UPI001F0B4317|nr:cyclic nucleotide-binding domain-containing protein [Bradyrhizobium canariense]